MSLRAAMAASILAASILAAPSAAQAQAAPPPTVLTTVDSLERSDSRFIVVGTVRGESTPSTLELWMYSTNNNSPIADSCERAFLLMMNRPGRFTLELRQPDGDYHSVCKLVRQ